RLKLSLAISPRELSNVAALLSVWCIAEDLGYKAVMFNLVFETNIPSIRLWESLGFQTIGQIPAAVELDRNQTTNALIMYRRQLILPEEGVRSLVLGVGS
ncbi:MAG: hypothetical protein AAFW70_09275, partial [Cyanobacteria bacterium J06635_10]